ncbi:hypothetical protein KIW84_034668 [Lathyrus oleraceus]|uniref:Mitochondrial protein n=1 Tax=Pisum sativum TaxID=3888 RepID=A0A9D4Y1S0_PEA|nr:hypothetical protein KIW84_034668 [Pisum sativum]
MMKKKIFKLMVVNKREGITSTGDQGGQSLDFVILKRLSQRLSNPTEEHLNAAFRILKHLKKEPTTGLLFQKYSNLTITRFSDSDWGAFKETCRSTTRFCFYLGSSLVSWKSKMQQIVFRSSPEAEYRVVANASCEA